MPVKPVTFSKIDDYKTRIPYVELETALTSKLL